MIKMRNRISLGMLARRLIHDFNTNLAIDSVIVKKGHEPHKTERLYNIFKLYTDGVLEAQDIVRELRLELAADYATIRKDLARRDEISQTGLEVLMTAREFAEVPDDLMVEVIERSREVFANLVRRYETIRGF